MFSGTPALDETRGKVMAQIVPAEMGDPGALEQLFPRVLKTRRYVKDAALPVPDCSRQRRSVLTASSFRGT